VGGDGDVDLVEALARLNVVLGVGGEGQGGPFVAQLDAVRDQASTLGFQIGYELLRSFKVTQISALLC
jgi:hypothetical protein